MDERDFVFWLQGALELGRVKTLDEGQVECVKQHMALVLENATDPCAAVREALANAPEDTEPLEESEPEIPPAEQPEASPPAGDSVARLTKADIRRILERSADEMNRGGRQRLERLLTVSGRYHECSAHRRIC